MKIIQGALKGNVASCKVHRNNKLRQINVVFQSDK